MKELLIIGSSNPNVDFIKNWKGEVWGFNNVYKKYKVDLILGVYSSVLEALNHKKEMGGDFHIYAKSNDKLCIKKFGNQIEYLGFDTSLFLGLHVNLFDKALKEGYDKIYVTGLNLKITPYFNSWIKDIRNFAYYHSDFYNKFEFIDNDYDYIVKDLKNIDYCYYEESKGVYDYDKSVIILGNGISRDSILGKMIIQGWEYHNKEIWACNEAYKEDIKITRMGSLHLDMGTKMLNYKKKYNKKWEIYSLEESLPDIKKFHYAHRSGNTGYQWILQALYEKYDYIYLIGFDFGGEDLYTETKTGNTFQNRFLEIIEEFGLSKIHFFGGIPNFLC